jgi:hypothetical protein
MLVYCTNSAVGPLKSKRIWNGLPIQNPEEEPEVYSLVFHPLELGEEAFVEFFRY